MKRSHLNFVVDSVALAAFIFLVATGVIMEFLLPAGSGHWTTLWGLDRHGWGSIHFWISVAFLAALAVHVYLHWKWIVSVVRKRPREGSGVRVGLGVFGLLALLAIAVAPLVSPVEHTDGTRSSVAPRWGLSEESEAILGSMTLGDVVESTGLTVDYLARELGLPARTTSEDRLGVLARENGFSVADVREAVERGLTAVVRRTEGTEPLATREQVPERPASVGTEPVASAEVPAPVEEAEEHAGENVDRPAGGADVRGTMTLNEIVELGVPREALLRELNLPAYIPMSESLGRLGRAHGFTMTQVRDLVEFYR